MLEDILNQLKTTLQTNLPAQLDAIDAARGATTKDVQAIYITEIERAKVKDYPYIVMDPELSNTSSLTAGRRRLIHNINIVIIHRKPEKNKLDLDLYRYVEAVEKVWKADITLAGKAQTSDITQHGYGEALPETEEGKNFVKVAVLKIEVEERI